MACIRAADDFPTIRARLKELRRERENVEGVEDAAAPDPLPVLVTELRWW